MVQLLLVITVPILVVLVRKKWLTYLVLIGINYQKFILRLKGFKKYGFSCLIIWDCELDNRDMVANKVREFTEGNPTIDQIYAWAKRLRIRKEIAKLEW